MSEVDERSGRGEPLFQTRIFIEKDGTVVIENLAEELLPLVRELDPDGELGLACRMTGPPAEDGLAEPRGGDPAAHDRTARSRNA